MACTTDDLVRKEVINICTAQSLGCISNFEVDVSCGKITAFFVSENKGFFSFSADCDIRVPWEKIVRIGEDVILVDFSDGKDKDKGDGCEWCPPPPPPPKKRRGPFF